MRKSIITAVAALTLALGACGSSPAKDFEAELAAAIGDDKETLCHFLTLNGEEAYGESVARDYPGVSAEEGIQAAKNVCGEDVFDGPTLEESYQEEVVDPMNEDPYWGGSGEETEEPVEVQSLEVGETGTYTDSDGNVLEVTLTGNVYLMPEDPTLEEALLVAFEVTNTGDSQGWLENDLAWVSDSGEYRNFISYAPMDEMYWLGAQPGFTDAYMPGTTSNNMLESVSVSEPGGRVVLMDYMGEALIEWSIPDSMSGTGWEPTLDYLGIDY